MYIHQQWYKCILYIMIKMEEKIVNEMSEGEL